MASSKNKLTEEQLREGVFEKILKITAEYDHLFFF